MKISVNVKPNAKANRIERIGDNEFLVWVKARPQEGQANQATREILAEYFSVSKSCINLLKGKTSKQKIFQIRESVF